MSDQVACDACNGVGSVVVVRDNQFVRQTCPTCNGTGRIDLTRPIK